MQQNELQKVLTTIKHLSDEAEQSKLCALRIQDEKKQSEMDKRALEAELNLKDQELDYVYHQLEIRDEENQELRNYIQCDEYFAEKYIGSYHQRVIEDQEEIIEDLRQDKSQLIEEVKWMKCALASVRAENEELKRINGEPRRRPEPPKVDYEY